MEYYYVAQVSRLCNTFVNLMKEDVTTTNDEIDQQLTALRDLLKLSSEERQTILAKHAAELAEYFVPAHIYVTKIW